MAFFRLIRTPNLIIVAITQALLYFNVLIPVYKEYEIRPQLDLFLFACFTFVTVCITAGGYIINDLLDQEADASNKPEKQIVGKDISEQVAGWLYGCVKCLCG